MSDDWFDELTNGEPPLMTDKQWFIIETQIDKTSISSVEKEEIYNRMNYITEIEAEDIIKKIYQNKIETDPQKQWLKMLKDGVFDND